MVKIPFLDKIYSIKEKGQAQKLQISTSKIINKKKKGKGPHPGHRKSKQRPLKL